MRINAIQSYNYKPAFAENNKTSEKKEQKITAKQIGYGLAGLAAIGLATYAIIRKGKKPSGAVVEDTAESVKGKLKPRPNSGPDLKPGAAEEPEKIIKPKKTEDAAAHTEGSVPDIKSEAAEEPEKIIKPKKTEDAAAPKSTEGSVPDAKPAQEEQVASANGSQEKPKTEPAAESSKNKETTEQSAAKNSNTEEQQNNNSVNSENDKELHSKNTDTPEQQTSKAEEVKTPENTNSSDAATDSGKTENSKNNTPPQEPPVERRIKVTPEILAPYKEGRVETKPFLLPGLGDTKPFEGVEKLKYTMLEEGKGRTYQKFYHNDKVYETNVYDDLLDEYYETPRVTRYNFAYENGSIVGVAKQDLEKDGFQHGIYKDGLFEPFPIMVKMKGEKEFHKVDAYTADALFELDKRFDPQNM
ncbi:MAG: hypothetical protein KIC80_07765 [Brachyspira sp.]|nr:hypothetical protein [Brachyspira sp.]